MKKNKIYVHTIYIYVYYRKNLILKVQLSNHNKDETDLLREDPHKKVFF